MKTVIKLKNPSSERLNKVLNHLLKFGYDDFVVLSTFNKEIENNIAEKMWNDGAKIVFLAPIETEDTYTSLLNIRGSLLDGFFLIYGEEIDTFDLKKAYDCHKNSTMLTTLLSTETKMIGAFFESEIFDYMSKKMNFEREVIARVFEDHEAQIYLSNNFKLILEK
ncbi:MAG: hypothetical protein IJ437_06150 [Clostridia bacterium]|nr:hypothetical protein [Clostridia bacterium]